MPVTVPAFGARPAPAGSATTEPRRLRIATIEWEEMSRLAPMVHAISALSLPVHLEVARNALDIAYGVHLHTHIPAEEAGR